MLLSACATRTAAGAIVAGAMLFGTVPAAFADPPAPGCTAADFEQVKSEVASTTSAYLFTHPDVNAFFSSLEGAPRDQLRTQTQTYLAENPQTQAEIADIRQPLRDMKHRCQ